MFPLTLKGEGEPGVMRLEAVLVGGVGVGGSRGEDGAALCGLKRAAACIGPYS